MGFLYAQLQAVLEVAQTVQVVRVALLLACPVCLYDVMTVAGVVCRLAVTVVHARNMNKMGPYRHSSPYNMDSA